MSFLICLTCITIFGNSPNVSPILTSLNHTNINNQHKLVNKKMNNLNYKIEFIPYEILAGSATSYADISLNIINKLSVKRNIKITNIKITSESQQVLMDSTKQQVKLPAKVTLAPAKTVSLTYRLTLPNRIYQPGKKVLALIEYGEGNNINTLISNLEAVAFMIP